MAEGNASLCGVPAGIVLDGLIEVVLSREHRGSETAAAQAVGRRVSKPRPLDPAGSGRRVCVPIGRPRLLSYAPSPGTIGVGQCLRRLTRGQSDCFDKKSPSPKQPRERGVPVLARK